MAETVTKVTEQDDNVTEVTNHGWYKDNPAFMESRGRLARVPGAAAAAGAVGGRKSGETRRKRAALREAARALLAVSPERIPGAEDLAEVLRVAGIDDATMAEALTLAQVLKAARGDTEAFKTLRDTSGERPVDLLHVSTGEVVDADTVGDLTDSELAELAAGADVALPVAPAQDPGPGTVEAQGPEDPGGIC